MSYSCDKCLFYSNNKNKYDRHLQTQKHKNNDINNEEETYCKYCHKKFKHKNSMYHHIKYSCKYNTDEDLKELVRLLNLQIKQKDKQLENQQKQIDRLMDKLQVTNITNNTTTNIQANIKLLCYKNTDISHLTENDYIQSLKQVNHCVKHLIERIHFNPEKPENMNIYISNLKDRYIMVYEEGNWNIKNKASEIDSLYNSKELMLEDWINEQYKYPELKEKFDKYVNNKDHDEVMNSIKEDIKLMMYNKKTIIENNNIYKIDM